MPSNWRGYTSDARLRLSIVAQGLYLDFLLTQGGGLSRPVVTESSRRIGELWKTCPTQALALGENASQLLKTLQAALVEDNAISLNLPDTKNGESWFYHALYRKTSGDLKIRRWASALRKASPFTRLLTCPILAQRPALPLADGQVGIASISYDEAEAIALHPATPYFLGYISDKWSDFAAPDMHTDYNIQLQRLNTRRATLGLFLRVCADSYRLSLLQVFGLFFFRILQKNYVTNAISISRFKQWKLSLREQMLSAYTSLLKISSDIDEIQRTHITEPGQHDWQNPEEVRLFGHTQYKLWATDDLRTQIADALLQIQTQTG